MVFILRDLQSGTYGFQLILEEGAIVNRPGSGIKRVLMERYGWDGPGSVMSFITQIRDVFQCRTYKIERDERGIYGMFILSDSFNQYEEFGWERQEALEEHIKDIISAFSDGQIRTVF